MEKKGAWDFYRVFSVLEESLNFCFMYPMNNIFQLLINYWEFFSLYFKHFLSFFNSIKLTILSAFIYTQFFEIIFLRVYRVLVKSLIIIASSCSSRLVVIPFLSVFVLRGTRNRKFYWHFIDCFVFLSFIFRAVWDRSFWRQ